MRTRHCSSSSGSPRAELRRRGLVVGEVGRGTFVAGNQPPSDSAVGEPTDGRIDLEFNFPTVPAQFALIAKSLSGLQRVDAVSALIGPTTQRRLENARITTAEFMKTARWQPRPDGIVFTGSGRQSMAAAVSALVPIGGRLGVEAVTYAMIKNIASRLGVTVVPIPRNFGWTSASRLNRAWAEDRAFWNSVSTLSSSLALQLANH